MDILSIIIIVVLMIVLALPLGKYCAKVFAGEKTFFDWAATKGLDRTKVAEIYGSFAINSKINRAKALAQTYNVQAVPEFIVDGKFLTSTDRVGSHAAIPAALDAVITKARAERPKT